MTRSKAREQMRREDADVKQLRRWETAPEVLLMHDSAYQVYFDPLTDTVEQIEIGGPGPDGQSEGDEPTITVLFENVDLFRTPAALVVDLIDGARTQAERHASRDEAVDWPRLGLSLWRSDPLDPAVHWESVSLMREELFDPETVARRSVQNHLRSAAAALWGEGWEAREGFASLVNAGAMSEALERLEQSIASAPSRTVGPSFWPAMALAAEGLGRAGDATRFREQIRPS